MTRIETYYEVPIPATLYVKLGNGDEHPADGTDLAKFNLVRGKLTANTISEILREAARDGGATFDGSVLQDLQTLVGIFLWDTPDFGTENSKSQEKLREVTKRITEFAKTLS